MSTKSTTNKMSYADKIGIATINLGSAPQTCTQLMRAGMVPNLVGDAGIGKTAVAKQIANALDAHFIDKIVSQLSASDFAIGFREPDGGCFKMLLSEWLTELIEVANTGKPVMLFLDEITRYQDQETASVIFSMISERSIYGNKLPKNVMIMCASNPMDGDYAVNDIMTDPAWRRRLCHIYVESDVGVWLNYAAKNDIDKRVYDFIVCHPNFLLDSEARSAGKIYGTPASWEKVSTLLKENSTLDFVPVPAVSSLVGFDVASAFADFVDNADYKLDPSMVWSNYKEAEKIIAKMKKDNRHDLVMNTVVGVGTMILISAPDVNTCVNNFVKFWSELPDEAMIKLNLVLTDRKPDQASYYATLMSAVQKTPEWVNVIYKRMMNATR